MSNKKYYIAIIEIDGNKLNQVSGTTLTASMAHFKDVAARSGYCEYYEILDIVALEQFRAGLKTNTGKIP